MERMKTGRQTIATRPRAAQAQPCLLSLLFSYSSLSL